jgi:hypothetical protein
MIMGSIPLTAVGFTSDGASVRTGAGEEDGEGCEVASGLWASVKALPAGSVDRGMRCRSKAVNTRPSITKNKYTELVLFITGTITVLLLADRAAVKRPKV